MIYPSRNIIKLQASIMKDFLIVKHKKTSLSSCYNCIAKMWGFKDWNTFSAQLDNDELLITGEKS